MPSFDTKSSGPSSAFGTTHKRVAARRQMQRYSTSADHVSTLQPAVQPTLSGNNSPIPEPRRGPLKPQLIFYDQVSSSNKSRDKNIIATDDFSQSSPKTTNPKTSKFCARQIEILGIAVGDSETGSRIRKDKGAREYGSADAEPRLSPTLTLGLTIDMSALERFF
ncbi:uncharacterized protein CPUR_02852 [Claviceps purpurea 20.1]|uniref:Uncharacterized protein n=1 Tax=Claviceps purpurea (strain 20.1) TaxID=1111077 RepID=M1W0B5_CLAP2|nr:uncharacterized protein CPUR_02852 [Claviceps purpurea 20.1]